MFELAAITNRALCRGNYLEQLEKIAGSGVSELVLREKELSPAAYTALAKQVLAICKRHRLPCTLHRFWEAALALGTDRIQLSLRDFERIPQEIKPRFAKIGVSVHSLEQAHRAVSLGATALTAGHIFPTACKEGLAPRGLLFLEELCREVPIPVYAIGGITPENAASVRDAGVAGACMMSSLMEAEEPSRLIRQFQASIG